MQTDHNAEVIISDMKLEVH